MNEYIFLFQSLLILYLGYQVNFQIISIPFKFDILSHHNYNNYNSTYFIEDYFKREIILDLFIGTPPQKINAKLNPDSECFLFKINQSNSSDIKKYVPNNSSSFSEKDGLIIYNPYKYARDIFHFPQINKNYSLFIFVENYTNTKNDSYIPVIGINIPLITFGNICPNFLLDLKNGNIINKIILSIKYNNKYEGELIIGDELSQYNPNKYIKSQYSTTYLNYQNFINFDSVYIPEKQYYKNYDNSIIKQKFNITNNHLHINSGFIIGTEEYKDYIDNNFFNLLFNKSICKIDIIPYKDNNDKAYTNDYYVYSCYSRHFTGQTSLRFPSTNYYQSFPSLIFSSKNLEYNFELAYDNLFEIISDKYYFLIIFKKNKNSNEKEMWDLGEPFYRKYTFSINKDAKTIGFYIGKEKNNNKTDTNINDDKKKEKNKNIKIRKIMKYLIEIIIINILLFIAYYFGVTVREKRKKKANELKDDDYEYYPEKNKDINDIKTESKDQQFVELNS